MDVCLIVGINIENLEFDFKNKLIVGVDRGLEYCYKHNLNVDYAIGDFDSYKEEVKAQNIIKLNPIKDETDLAYAIEYFKDYEKIYVLGSIKGKRIEHFIANLVLFQKYDNLVYLDDDSSISLIENNTKLANDKYKYVSFFAIEEVKKLCLEGFKYELQNYDLKPFDPLCVSNEINTIGTIKFESGRLLIIKTIGD